MIREVQPFASAFGGGLRAFEGFLHDLLRPLGRQVTSFTRLLNRLLQRVLERRKQADTVLEPVFHLLPTGLRFVRTVGLVSLLFTHVTHAIIRPLNVVDFLPPYERPGRGGSTLYLVLAGDSGTERDQSLVDALVTTFYLPNVVDFARPLGPERRNEEGHAGPDIRAFENTAL